MSQKICLEVKKSFNTNRNVLLRIALVWVIKISKHTKKTAKPQKEAEL